MKLKTAVCTALTVLSLAASAAAGGAPVDKATDEEKAAAGARFKRAMEAFEASKYEEAIDGFQASYDIVKSPNSRFMKARALARLGENAAAYAELTAVIDEANQLGENYAETAVSARAKRDEIEPRIGLLKVELYNMPKGTKLVIDGEPVTTKLEDPVPVLPGEMKVVATTPKGEIVEGTVNVETGASKSIRLVLEKEDPNAAEAKKKYVERDAAHPSYWLEIDAQGMYTILEPPGPANQGGGPGGRLSLRILDRGFINGINDNFAISTGADWAASSADPHIWIPIVGQWNFFVHEKASLLVEPGVAIMVGAGTHALPALYAGARYMFIKDRLGAIVRLGIPQSSIGLSLLL